jgi:hypothetical protein
MLFKDTVEKSLARFKLWHMGESLQLSGRMASWHVRARMSLQISRKSNSRVSSQWGQDGIIDWLIERAEIPPDAQTFIEFGVEEYRQSNTRFLLQNRNWRGFIMDGDPELLRRSRAIDWRGGTI